MAMLFAVVLGFSFGAGDQYLGSLDSFVLLGAWTYSVSVMSAPWLVLPFVFGATQRSPRRAMLIGLLAVAAALSGYFVMTLSPIEGVPLSRFAPGLVHLTVTQLPYIIGGAISAPLFSYLGQRWRAERSWICPVIAAATLCFEPVARMATGQLSPPQTVWLAEVALGACLAAYFLASGVTYRQRLRDSAKP